MKYATLLFFTFLFSIFSIGQEIKFFEGDLNALKAQASKENKLIFIDCYTTWCGPCKWMAKNTFTNKEVIDFYDNNFINYQLDMEKGEGLAFAKEYGIRAYPTLIFIDGKGQLMHKAVGAQPAEKFLETGKIALDPNERIGELLIRYNNGERDPEFLVKYLTKAGKSMMNVTDAANEYFAKLSDKDLMNKSHVELIATVINSPANDAFKFLVKNQEECQKLTDFDLDRYIEYTYSRGLNRAHNEDDYNKLIKEIKNSGYAHADKLLAKEDYSKLLKAKDKDWKVITEKIDSYFKKYAPEDSGTRNQMAWSYYTNDAIQDTELLEKALNWAKESVDLKQEYANTDTYAALLYKLGRKDQAIKVAEKAIALAKESGDDSTETEQLLEKIKML